MSTFDGFYLKEPADFLSVATEQDLIQSAQDPDQTSNDFESFADIDEAIVAGGSFGGQAEDLLDKIKAVVNEAVNYAENLVHSYARTQGYAIPLNVGLDPVIKQIALDVAWIYLRFRRGILSDEQKNEAMNRARNGELRDIARNVITLASPKMVGIAKGAHVYGVTSSERLLSREMLEDW